jgi:nitroreductase
LAIRAILAYASAILWRNRWRATNLALPSSDSKLSGKKALRAPTIIGIAATARDNPKVPEVEQILAVGAAAQNILVASHALGFGGFWRTGSLAYDPDVKRASELSETDSIVGFIYIGSVGQPGRPHQVQMMTS